MTKTLKFCLLLVVFNVLTQSFVIVSDSDQVFNLNSNQNQNIFQKNQVDSRKSRHLQATAVTAGTGVTYKTISYTKFTGLTLYHELSATLTRGQIYEVRGQLNSAATKAMDVSFEFQLQSDATKSYRFKSTVSTGLDQFKIKVDTRLVPAGDYKIYLYVLPSLSFYTTRGGLPNVPVKILDSSAQLNQPTKISPPSKPAGFIVLVSNNAITLSWTKDLTVPIYKIVFTQPGVTPVQYLLSNFQSSFQVPNKDFKNFQLGKDFLIEISSAYSSLYSLSGRLSAYSIVDTKTFKAGMHHFAEIKSGIILGAEIPWWGVAVNSNILIQGTANATLSNTIVMQQPQFVIGKYQLTSTTGSTISNGSSFSTTINMAKQGVYILQINDNSGQAVLNRPIYVGSALPIIPDFVDLAQTGLTQPTNLSDQVDKLLTLVNQKRSQWQRNPLTIEPILNTLAQGHSTDMATNNFFGHINLKGQGPQERATALGIKYGVGQNVAAEYNLTNAHLRLCRSPGHLANIVNAQYQLVGFGVAAQGTKLFVTENFAIRDLAKNPLTQTELAKVKADVLQFIKSKNPSIQAENTALSASVFTWQTTINPTKSLLQYIFNDVYSKTKALSTSSATVSYSSNIVGSFNSSYFNVTNPAFTQVGLSAIQAPDTRVQIDAVFI